MTTADWVGSMSALAAALSAYFAFRATRQARLQIESSDLHARQQAVSADRSTEAAVFLEIYKGWNEIYPQYRKLLNEPFDPASVISTAPDFDGYSAGESWQRMRPVFAFHEYLGACIRAELLRENTLFSLVGVNAALWEKFSPLIRHFRDQGRTDLYIGWEYLIDRHRLYEPGKEHLPLVGAQANDVAGEQG
jgi:hypothetical protein